MGFAEGPHMVSARRSIARYRVLYTAGTAHAAQVGAAGWIVCDGIPYRPGHAGIDLGGSLDAAKRAQVWGGMEAPRPLRDPGCSGPPRRIFEGQ